MVGNGADGLLVGRFSEPAVCGMETQIARKRRSAEADCRLGERATLWGNLMMGTLRADWFWGAGRGAPR